MNVLNVENAGAIFYFAQISHKIRAQLLFLGIFRAINYQIPEMDFAVPSSVTATDITVSQTIKE
jgi:hypothetical protein